MTGSSPVIWRDGVARSAIYEDIYFSVDDGLAESRAVFLGGCGLPDAWSGRERFTVAELGFGSGLNIVALLDLWRRTRAADGRLHVFSLEAHPLSRGEAERALAAFPEVADRAALLLERWPGVRQGYRRMEISGLGFTLDMAVMEAAEALAQWQGAADAWFLDGFSPSLNPAMWRPEVLDLIAARSAPGARLATFTVAGAVRRGLAERGFEVTKMPGHGRKRERLEARMPGSPAPPPKPGRTVVVGGGIAGSAVVRALGAQGVEALQIADPDAPAASANPAALVMPALDAGGGARAAFYAQAFTHAAGLYCAMPNAVIAEGALQLETAARDGPRFDAIAGQAIFEPGAVVRTTGQDCAARLGEASAAGGLWFDEGLVVEPEVIVRELAPVPEAGRVVALGREGATWRLTLEDGREILADTVIVAAGWGTAALAPGLGLSAVRGQASWASGPSPGAPAAFGAYAIPTRDGTLFGATHDRGQTTTEHRPEDDRRNLGALAVLPELAARIAGNPVESRAAIRATTPDRMPHAGRMEPGLYVLSGLGSRGFVTAPLLAEHLAAEITGAPSPLPADLAALVHPGRFSAKSG